jgi:hypothetical protein
VGGPESRQLDPVLGDSIGIDRFSVSDILGKGVALVSLSVSLPHLRLYFRCKNSMYRNSN